MTRKQYIITTLLSGAVFVLAFMVSSAIWFRLDLTKNKAHTISAASRDLYLEIPDPVRITYFISDRLAQAHPAPGEIADLLREYAAYSRGMIRFSRRDPVKSNFAGETEELGILPQQIQVVEKNEATVATVYTGILIEYLDRREVLPVVFSLDTLEYDLTSRIRSLVRDRERELGVLAAEVSKEWDTEYGLLGRELAASGYKVRGISPGDEIPESLPCLFVLGGAAYLDDWALYRIDHYISSGGRALFALDGVAVDTQNGTLEAKAVGDLGLLAMLAGYGAVLRPVLVHDPSALSMSYQIQNPNGSVQINIVRYPQWIAVPEQNGNPSHPVTARFAGIDLFWASPLELSPPEGAEAESLFWSSPGAWLQTGDFITRPDMIQSFSKEAAETGGPKILGASLSGVFPSAFAGRPKPVREGSAENLPDLPASSSPSRIIVVGDSDFAGAIMGVSRGEGRNLDFLLRAADWLGNDDDIIGIRNRQGGAGRLDRIPEGAVRDAAMNFSRTLNVFVIPILVVAAGLFLAWKRRQKGKNRTL
ncbi:MAG: GldG family protein [Treponema sp.]|jgi:ABC-type uncharacterized transport system involved in gliding motility auxiliary subunit|nr:GldG family protein [Treponema sp.]